MPRPRWEFHSGRRDGRGRENTSEDTGALSEPAAICSVPGPSAVRPGSGGNVRKRALAKLQQLDVALILDDLRVPPGNRLETLVGDRQGQYSIRVNKQWRLCFRWTQAGPEDVEISKHYE